MKRFEVGKNYRVYSYLADKITVAKCVKREGNYAWFKIGSKRMEKVPVKVDIDDDFEYISSDANPSLRFSAFNEVSQTGDTVNESERRITKAKRALYGKKQGVRTIGIVSAENPMVMQMTPEENAKRTANFIKQLEFYHVPYVKSIGKYGNEENSFVLYNIGLKDLEYFASTKRQESFIFGVVEDEVVHFKLFVADDKTANELKYHPAMQADGIIRADENAEDYTIIGKDFKFNIPLEQINEGLKQVNEEINRHCAEFPKYAERLDETLNDCTDDRWTVKFRACMRLHLFGNGCKVFYQPYDFEDPHPELNRIYNRK